MGNDKVVVEDAASVACSAMFSLQQPEPLSSDGNMAANWNDWKTAFDFYLVASGRDQAKDKEKCALFLHIVGKYGRELYEEFDFETDEKDNYKILVTKFEKRCAPEKNVNFERHCFFETMQANDNLDKYISKLRVKSKTCDFGKLRESLILTQLIRGISDIQLRERLLRQKNLELDDAVSWCRAAEAASVQASAVRGGAALGGALEAVRARPAPAPAPATARRHYQQQVSTRDNQYNTRSKCLRCDFTHVKGKCPAFDAQCYRCGRRGHFSRCCVRFSKSVREVECSSDEDCGVDDGDCEELIVDAVGDDADGSAGWYENIDVNGMSINFKLDCGADTCVISRKTFDRSGFTENVLRKGQYILREVSRRRLPIYGHFEATLSKGDYSVSQKIFVLDIDCNSLLGRNACEKLNLIKRLNVNNIDYIANTFDCDYKSVFEGIGCLPTEYNIPIDESVQPIVNATRKIPIKLKPKLREELERMERLGVIVREEGPTDWVSSVVLVERPDGRLRLCLDPQSLNKAVKRSHFQLPTFDEISSNLAGAKYFTKLDANKGFWMLPLNESSSKLCTFSTPFGRYRFLRMPFGISCASEIFHNEMLKIFRMEGVEIFIDDLLIWGKNKKEHDERLEKVLNKAKKYGVKFNRQKCEFYRTSVSYLGHIFNEKGMTPDGSKIKSIQSMEPPKSRKDLERFLGMVNYLSRYIPKYAEISSPLRELMKKDREWEWHESHQKALNELKRRVSEAPVLRYYDPALPVTLSVDASGRGLGACLLQRGHPVAYAARMLAPNETRWAQIEKELLAIVFACSKFHQYIYGHKSIDVESDHKPLEIIFKKSLNETPARLQRMLLRLQKSLNVRYVPGKYMYIADTLSRSATEPHTDTDMFDKSEVHVNLVYENTNFSNEKLQLISEETKNDSSLKLVKHYCINGWPHTKNLLPGEVKPYWSVKDDLHLINGIIFRNSQVVIPGSLKSDMLNRIHEGHLGIEKCKRRAREVLYWPGLSRDVGQLVERCAACQRRRDANRREPLAPHAPPERPWQVLATDIFHVLNKNYLLVVDYYSKYVEIAPLKDLQSSTIIMHLKNMFARFGIPDRVVSDNAGTYASQEFKTFAQQWEFDHVTSSPHYPRSNGLAERNVRTIKNILLKTHDSGQDPYIALLNMRNTCITGERQSPAQLLMGRRLADRLPKIDHILQPSSESRTVMKEDRSRRTQAMKKHYDRGTRQLPPLHEGQAVRVRHAADGCWSRARVEGVAPTPARGPPRSYWVRDQMGSRYRRNRQHIIVDKGENPAQGLYNRSSTEESTNDSTAHRHDYDDMSAPFTPAATCASAPRAGADRPEPTPNSNYRTTRSGRRVITPDRF